MLAAAERGDLATLRTGNIVAKTRSVSNPDERAQFTAAVRFGVNKARVEGLEDAVAIVKAAKDLHEDVASALNGLQGGRDVRAEMHASVERFRESQKPKTA